MEVAPDSLFRLVMFTTGRRIHALRQVRKVALTLDGLAPIVARIDEALEHDLQTRVLDNRWAGNGARTIYNDDVAEIDNWVDQLLSSIRDVASAYAKGPMAASGVQEMAERFLAMVFPGGVRAITSLPYVDQVAAVEGVLIVIQRELGSEVDALMLRPLIERLTELAGEYRAAIERSPKQLRFATVKQARVRGQQNLLEVVAMILGRYYSFRDPEHIAARSELLAPIMLQATVIQELRKARRAVSDIDPDAAANAEAGVVIDAEADARADAEAGVVIDAKADAEAAEVGTRSVGSGVAA